MIEIEKKDKEHGIRTGQRLTESERSTLVKEVLESLPEEERAALEALQASSPEVV